MKLLTNPKSHGQPFLKKCLCFLRSFVIFITVLLEKHRIWSGRGGSQIILYKVAQQQQNVLLLCFSL